MRCALITGTSSGIGDALAKHLLKKKHDKWMVIGVSRSSPDSDLLSNPNYTHVTADISKESIIETLKIVLENQKIDLLVNNSGLYEASSFKNSPLSSVIHNINEIIDTNVKGSMYVTKAVIHKFNIYGRIIFMNSVAGVKEIENEAIYSASKHALSAFAGIISKELKPNVRVTSIHPGGVMTPLWKHKSYPGNRSILMDVKEILHSIDFILDSSNNVDIPTLLINPVLENH